VVHSSSKGIDAVVGEIRRILHATSREGAAPG
jgi:hypothetical protein